MTADSNAFDYTLFKQLNKIQSVDHDEEGYIISLGESANRTLQDELTPYVNSVPLTDANISASMKEVATLLASSTYQAPKNETKSQTFLNLYKLKRDAIITALKADPSTNTRTKYVVVASTRQTEPLKSRDS